MDISNAIASFPVILIKMADFVSLIRVAMAVCCSRPRPFFLRGFEGRRTDALTQVLSQELNGGT